MIAKHSKNLSNSIKPIKSSNKKQKAKYFEETKVRDDDSEEITVIICQIKKKDNTICGISYVYTSRLTENVINHLRNIYEINKNRNTKNNKQVILNKQHTEEWQIQLEQSLTTWIIKDSQPIHIEIQNKIFIITTNNDTNVKRAVLDMKNMKWLNCTSHTLQLVVTKRLISAKVLIKRVKHIIKFFMRPKQCERLEEVQARFLETQNINDCENENKNDNNTSNFKIK
ncbi:28483_t:CDS:2 [Racocetra persica]|uniref:28483_t:CDS:1 n=1 Tax=Racocetra persica TaxID=160502 RepID=A0ACA9LI59_9GLOM|nr:28483_t:CDS:2 [Racocetra persica]